MLAPDLQPFVLLGAALVIFFFSTRRLPLGTRVLAWLVGAGLVVAAWFGGPLVPTDFSDLSGLLRDQGAHAGALRRNAGTLASSLNPTLDLFLLAVGGLGILALFGFAPRRDDGEPSERPLLATLFGVVVGAFVAISLAAAFGYYPTRNAYLARGEDVNVVDGDTLRVGDITLRLAGIDAPDFYAARGEEADPRAQTCLDPDGKASACGEAAMKAVSELMRGGMVVCERVDAASAPVLVRCSVRKAGSAFDLGERAASLGFAAASDERGIDYTQTIAAAQSARRGFWSGCSLTPAAWRNARAREAFRARKFEEIAAGDFVGRDRCPPSATPPAPPAPEPPPPRRRRAS